MGYDRSTLEPVMIADAKCTAQTERAILVVFEGKQQWIPQSQVTPLSEVWKLGDEGTLIITGWFAEKEGLV